MIQLQELTKAFGDRVLLDHVTWQITDRERVGLCGPNGAGKTTLLRMMAGLDEADSGAILKPTALTVGYLPQDGLTHSGRTVFEEASSAFGEPLAMKEEMHAREARRGDEAMPHAAHGRLRREPEADGAHCRVSAAGWPDAFGEDGLRGSQQRVRRAPRHEGGDARARGAARRRCDPARGARGDARALQRSPGSLSAR